MARVTLMSVLSVAVVAIGALLALDHGPSPDRREMRLLQLVRLLGDSDPDVRRDAEAAIKRAGPDALPALKQAAESTDAVLAARAKQVLLQIEGAPVVHREAEVSPVEPAPPAPIEISLQLLQSRLTAGEPPRLYLRLHNATPLQVLIARHRLGPIELYGAFASFEITGADGIPISVPADVAPDGTDPEFEVVGVESNQLIDLIRRPMEVNRPLLGRLGMAGTYRVRFVYDAGERSAYRDAIVRSHSTAGVPLPAGRIVSNTVTIVVE